MLTFVKVINQQRGKSEQNKLINPTEGRQGDK